MPRFEVPRRAESPPEEFHRIIEAKHILIIFNVVLGEKVVYLGAGVIIVDVAGRPLVLCREVVGITADVGQRGGSFDRAFGKGGVAKIAELADGLGFPEAMPRYTGEGQGFLDSPSNGFDAGVRGLRSSIGRRRGGILIGVWGVRV